MAKLTKREREDAKHGFASGLCKFVENLRGHVSAEDGGWTIKGFIDIYRNIYTISSDTKIVSKILEIHLFPKILQFAKERHYSIVLPEHQNWYPDLSFVSQDDERIKFAVDLKTTYRDLESPGHVNGFTLGSHGAYFKDRNSTKNIQFPYGEYSGHFCLGIIYTRADARDFNETEVINVKELLENSGKAVHNNHRKVTTVDSLRSIVSVIKDFQFFICEKWQLASDQQGSGNTANIGSITFVDDILKGNGIFAKLGEDWFDEYWMNYGLAMKKKGKAIAIRKLTQFMDFKGGNKDLIVPVVTKKRQKL